jgi:hypothetical protein
MPTPLPEALSTVLRSDSTAALAALMVIAASHRDLLAWAARMLGAEPPVEAKGPKSNGPAKQARSAHKPKGKAAHRARRREARDADDQALLEAMRDAPEGTIGDWATAIGKGRSSTVSALKRLRDASQMRITSAL